jgi:hypothetical protein
MESMPQRDDRLLGQLFYIFLLTRLAVMLATVAMELLGSKRWVLMFMLANLPCMAASPFYCAVIAGKRRTVGFGLLIFAGVVMLHLVTGYFWLSFIMERFD